MDSLLSLSTNPFVAAALVSLATKLLHYIQYVPIALAYILMPFLDIGWYTITDRDTCKNIQRRVGFSCNRSHDGKALGFCAGRWFIGDIQKDYEHYRITLIATSTTLARLTTNDIATPTGNDDVIDEATTITVWQRTGPYNDTVYYERDIPLQIERSRNGQQIIMESIIAHQDRHNHTVAFVYGPPGSGKSMLGLLLAKHYNAAYINSMKPWEPGNYLAEMYAEIEPTKENPLVMVFDEVDVVLHAVNAGIPLHKGLPISITNKSGWNQFMDEIGRGMYPYLILLMTSNRSATCINELDPSYLRPGRVNVCMELTGPKED